MTEDEYWSAVDEWPRPAPRVRRAGPGATVLAAALLGLAEALEPTQRERPPQVIRFERPLRTLPVEVHLDPDDPSSSVATIRD